MAAALRDKDDYVNASVGGALAGSIFGIKSQYDAIHRSGSESQTSPYCCVVE